MKIVIVDDNIVNVTLMKGLVRQLPDSEPVAFTSPEEGLAWCLAHDPDLVVVDYMMPRLDGLTFIKAFRSDPSKIDVPVLMITSNHELDVRYEALNQGANDFLTKPVDRMEFLARTRNLLALRKSQKALADRAAWLADEVCKATAEIVQRERDTIFRLSRAAEYRDPETGAHVMRMAHYSQLIALQLGLPAGDVELLLQAAPMHDIGKVGTPDHILLKPGPLTPDELVIMRDHAMIGFEILRDSPSPFLQLAASIARSHHEKFDGTGYPLQLVGEAIPLVGRIVAVADVFDALTSIRPYKTAWPLEQALTFLQDNAGSHFDPACVHAFVQNRDGIHQIRAKFQDDLHDIAYRRFPAAAIY